MKEVAVVTLYDENNYGNRLQNYAVQKSLEKIGCKVETVVAKKKSKRGHSLKFHIANILCEISPRLISTFTLNFSRVKNFEKFTRKRINTRYIITDDGNLPYIIRNEYDYFVVGSDQVWNPSWGNYENRYNNMFLLFAPCEKKVCFSPSFGVSNIPLEWKYKFADGLNGFNMLSVREASGADIIKKLTGRNAEVLIDPTLMLNDDEWLKVAKRVKIKNRPYVFEYFLGERDDDELNKLSKENNLSRLTLMDKNNPYIYITNPSEFIYMISKSDLVCTDSFHACVFSIIFEKPFVVFRRNDDKADMYSRIDNLLKMFKVKSDEMPVRISPKVRDDVLKIERKKVIDFLKRNLKYED